MILNKDRRYTLERCSGDFTGSHDGCNHVHQEPLEVIEEKRSRVNSDGFIDLGEDEDFIQLGLSDTNKKPEVVINESNQPIEGKQAVIELD